jgi:hypothetical protein
MRNAGLDQLIWVLIYGGLLLVSLGLFVWRRAAPSGWALVALGSLLAAAGALLVWVRSRRPADIPSAKD